jgi:hypothetical protein
MLDMAKKDTVRLEEEGKKRMRCTGIASLLRERRVKELAA